MVRGTGLSSHCANSALCCLLPKLSSLWDVIFGIHFESFANE